MKVYPASLLCFESTLIRYFHWSTLWASVNPCSCTAFKGRPQSHSRVDQESGNELNPGRAEASCFRGNAYSGIRELSKWSNIRVFRSFPAHGEGVLTRHHGSLIPRGRRGQTESRGSPEGGGSAGSKTRIGSGEKRRLWGRTGTRRLCGGDSEIEMKEMPSLEDRFAPRGGRLTVAFSHLQLTDFLKIF